LLRSSDPKSLKDLHECFSGKDLLSIVPSPQSFHISTKHVFPALVLSVGALSRKLIELEPSFTSGTVDTEDRYKLNHLYAIMIEKWDEKLETLDSIIKFKPKENTVVQRLESLFQVANDKDADEEDCTSPLHPADLNLSTKQYFHI
jgi:hypothetical protein